MLKKTAPFLAGIAFGLVLNGAVAVAAIPAPLRGLLGQARADVTQIEQLSARVNDPHLRRSLREATSSLHYNLDSISSVVDHPPPPRMPPVVSEQELRTLLAAMDRATFSHAQVTVVRDMLATNNRRFTSDQVIRLMSKVTFSTSQVEIGTMLYPYVVDPGRWFLVIDSLTFSNSREELRRRTIG